MTNANKEKETNKNLNSKTANAGDENYTKYDYYNLASPSTEKYRYFKLEIKETKDSNVMQMSEFILNYSACVHNWEKRKPLLRRPVLSAMQSKK